MRAIVNGVSFYTTRTAIKRGVGDSSNVNLALQLVLERMGKDAGLATTIVMYDGRMNRISYDVQLNK
jgi:hypothetical protein